jgi:hypothetical protein
MDRFRLGTDSLRQSGGFMNTIVLAMNELPPGLNEIINAARNNKYLSAKLKKEWHKRIGVFVRDLPALHGGVWLECVWYVKNRRRDSDNIEACQKFILDSLVEQNRIDEDNLYTIQSPKIHHFVITDFNGFSMYIRDKEAFQKRLGEDLSLPPSGDISPKLPTTARPVQK